MIGEKWTSECGTVTLYLAIVWRFCQLSRLVAWMRWLLIRRTKTAYVHTGDGMPVSGRHAADPNPSQGMTTIDPTPFLVAVE